MRVKEEAIPILMYMKDVKSGTISDNQDVQRKFCSDNAFVNGIGVTILTGDYLPPIILCDVPYDNGTKQTYIADGCQRTAALMKIRYGRHKFTSTTEGSDIEYQAAKVDQSGKLCKDDRGNILWEKKTFNIKNKTFDDFPQELKDQFDRFQLKTATHPNCTMKDVSTYVRRYNNHRGMNTSQKALTYLDRYARVVKNIADSGFYKNCMKPSDTERRNGTYERLTCECAMAVFHLEDWKKEPRKITAYLNEYSSFEEFNRIQDDLNTLEFICDDSHQDIFVSKNLAAWVCVFDRFRELKIKEEEFVTFLNRFKKYLHSIVVDEFGTSWDQINVKNTKDKSVVSLKINLLTHLMKDYFKSYVEENEEEEDVLSFARRMVGKDIIQDDIDEAYDMLDSYKIDRTSKLLDWQNEQSLIALIVYSMKKDIDLDEWIVSYFNENTMYFKNQEKNYIHMKHCLQDCLQLKTEVA